jgi:hypothetical protein
MSEIATPVQLIEVTYGCDKKGCDGEMKPTDTVLMSNPPKYLHICNKCNVQFTLTKAYPVMQHREMRHKEIK